MASEIALPKPVLWRYLLCRAPVLDTISTVVGEDAQGKIWATLQRRDIIGYTRNPRTEEVQFTFTEWANIPVEGKL